MHGYSLNEVDNKRYFTAATCDMCKYIESNLTHNATYIIKSN